MAALKVIATGAGHGGRPSAPRLDPDDPLRSYSPRLMSAFFAWLRVYLARNFDAVRVAGEPPPIDRPTVFYTNHPSWWDPVVLLWVLGRIYPGRRFYGPMDAAALQRYALLKRFGVFGVEQGTKRGTAAFLRWSRAVLASPGGVLCVTAEGAFADPRSRPLRLARGVSHLLYHGQAGQAVPIALEYPFWRERKPEALLMFGDALRDRASTPSAQHAAVEAALTRGLDALALRAIARDERAFRTLLDGTRGVGGVYDLYRRARARAAGRRFDASHGSSMR